MIALLLLACATEALPPPPASSGGDEPAADSGAPAVDSDAPEDSDPPGGDTDPPPETSDFAPLEAPALLRRLSLDLRGVLPSAEELDAVEADPEQLAVLREAFLEDPRLEDRLVSMLAEQWRTRIDLFDIRYYDYGLDESQRFEFVRAVGEEPLRLMAYVAANDLHWGEVLTADYSLANEMIGEIWPVERPEGEGWQVSRYTDGRPAAGVLTSNGLWWRYRTTMFNYNRSRAAAIFKLLVCEDILTRPVTFSVSTSLLDTEGTEEAIRSDPYCLTCHASIEPVAATLFGFFPEQQNNTEEMSSYHPEREPMGADLLEVTPAWAGMPVEGLAHLGAMIAADPRFPTCTAETMAQALWRRSIALEDFERVDALREVFLDSDMRLKALLRAVTDTDIYRAAGPAEGADEAAVAREQTRRMLSPDQLSSAVADLTGFVWRHNGTEMMADDTDGVRILAGGVDGLSVTRPLDQPSLTWALVVKRLAEAGAGAAVTEGLVDTAAAPGDDDFEARLEALHWRLYATRAGADWLAEVTEFWQQIDDMAGPEAAWTALLSAMLRDPAFVSY